jgi:hypothetical protein
MHRPLLVVLASSLLTACASTPPPPAPPQPAAQTAAATQHCKREVIGSLISRSGPCVSTTDKEREDAQGSLEDARRPMPPKGQ